MHRSQASQACRIRTQVLCACSRSPKAKSVPHLKDLSDSGARARADWSLGVCVGPETIMREKQGPEDPALFDVEPGVTGWRKGQRSFAKPVWERKPVPKHVIMGYLPQEMLSQHLRILRPSSTWMGNNTGRVRYLGWLAGRPHFFADLSHQHFRLVTWPIHNSQKPQFWDCGQVPGQPLPLLQAFLSRTSPVQPARL